jgi:hypothetical protein
MRALLMAAWLPRRASELEGGSGPNAAPPLPACWSPVGGWHWLDGSWIGSGSGESGGGWRCNAEAGLQHPPPHCTRLAHTHTHTYCGAAHHKRRCRCHQGVRGSGGGRLVLAARRCEACAGCGDNSQGQKRIVRAEGQGLSLVGVAEKHDGFRQHAHIRSGSEQPHGQHHTHLTP